MSIENAKKVHTKMGENSRIPPAADKSLIQGQCRHRPLHFWAVGPIRPSLVRGLRPRNAPSPTTCLADQVSTFGTGACPRGVRPTTFLQLRQFPVGAGLVPALARPTDVRHRKARPGACTASRPKTVNNASRRSHGFPPDCSHPKTGMHTARTLERLDTNRTVNDNSCIPLQEQFP